MAKQDDILLSTEVIEYKEKISGNFYNGVNKDPEDPRDYKVELKDIPTAESVNSTSKFSLVDYAGEIENQLDTGSCVANSACSALEIMTSEAGKSLDFSRLFVYWNLREPYQELKGKDDGSYIRDAFKVINHFGVPPEADWPFQKKLLNVKPGQDIFQKALNSRVIEYKRVISLNQIKALLLDGKPVIFSMALGEQFFYLKGSLEKMRYRKINKTANKLAGYHAMTIVGYDDNMNGGSFIVENSWSEAWGDFGFCAIPYKVFFSDAMDAWVCTKFETDLIKPEPEPEPEFVPNKKQLKWIKRFIGLINKRAAAGRPFWKAICQYFKICYK